MAKTKFEKHYSLVHATKVLKLVRAEMRKTEGFDVTVDCWSNGREQGYCLTERSSKDPKEWVQLCFAQQRNSDSIVVIAGPSNSFEISTNMPNEELWKTSAQEFWPDEKAVKAIVGMLTRKRPTTKPETVKS